MEPAAHRTSASRKDKGERRVRFADTMGLELVSIFLFDFISNYYIAKTIRDQNLKQIKAAPHPRADGYAHCNYNYHSYSYHSKTSAAACNNNGAGNNNNHYNNYNCSNTNSNTGAGHRRPVAASAVGVGVGVGAPRDAAKTASPALAASALAGSGISGNSNSSSSSSNSNTNSSNSHRQFTLEFTQPISLVSFKERVRLNKVHLETCHVNSIAGHASVSCTIRVLNLAFDKSIIVRYTTDDWHTYTDSLASYVPGSNDGQSDKFTSTFSLTNRVSQLQVGQRIIFAIRYTADKRLEYWDNNAGRNYSVKVTQ